MKKCSVCGKDIEKVGGGIWEDGICMCEDCIDKEFAEYRKERRAKRKVLRELNDLFEVKR